MEGYLDMMSPIRELYDTPSGGSSDPAAPERGSVVVDGL